VETLAIFLAKMAAKFAWSSADNMTAGFSLRK
jgi:hypothetical protein